jgi:GAF domain-containing protein
VNEEGHVDSGEALSRAQEVVKHQAAEIEALRARLGDEQFARELRQALCLAASAGTIAAPVTHSRLLELIVQTSMQVTSAEAAGLFLIDEEAQQLQIKVALGTRAAAIRDLRVPLGHGIAGLVAVTGQPMIVADADRDPRQASDIARAVGYTPRSILCVPLHYNDRVIGVLELLDKQGTRSFIPADMELLSIFAEQAAIAIEQSFTIRNVSELLAVSLEGLWGSTDDEKRALQQGARSFARHLEGAPLYDRALDLAALVREIVWCGESELKLCESILQSFAEHLRSQPASSPPKIERWP